MTFQKIVSLILKIYLIIGIVATSSAQKVSINDVVSEILTNSIDRKILKLQEKQNSLRYSMFKTSVLPIINGNINLPNFNRSITEIVLPDGSKALREQNAASASISLSISQKIPFTGGRLNIENNLSRLDQFGFNRSTFYSSSWFNISYNQPIISFNEYKYDLNTKMLENKMFEINTKKNIQNIHISVAEIYWDIILHKKRRETILQAKDLLYKTKKMIVSRYIERRILSIDTLEIDFQQKQYEFELTTITPNLQTHLAALNSFGIKRRFLETDDFESPALDNDVFNIPIDTAKLIESVQSNASLKNKIDSLNLSKNVRISKIQRAPQINFNSNIGYNNSTSNLGMLFANPSARMGLNLSISIPILTWEVGKKSQELANYQLEETLLKNELEKKQAISEAYNIINNFNSIHKEIQLLEIQHKNIEEQLKIYEILLIERDTSIDIINRLILRKIELLTNLYSKYKQLYLMKLKMNLLLIDN